MISRVTGGPPNELPEPPKTGPVPWLGHGGRTIEFTESTLLHNVSKILEFRELSVLKSSRKPLEDRKIEAISHSLNAVVEKTEDRSELLAIEIKLKNCINRLEENNSYNDFLDSEQDFTKSLDDLLTIIHDKLEANSGEEAASTTAESLQAGKASVPETKPTESTHTAAVIQTAPLSNASEGAAPLLSTNTIATQSSHRSRLISAAVKAEISIVAKSVSTLLQRAASAERHPAISTQRPLSLALAGNRLGRPPISWERRQALQKIVALPVKSIISQIMLDHPHTLYNKAARISIEDFTKSQKNAAANPRTKEKLPTTTGKSENEIKPSLAAQMASVPTVKQNSTSHQQSPVYYSLPPVATDFSVANRSFQTLTEGSKPLLAGERATSMMVFLVPLEAMIDQVNKMQPPVIPPQPKPPSDPSVQHPLAKQSAQPELATKSALQEQLETVQLAVTELVEWEKKKRDPCIAEKQIEELLKLLETLIGQWQHQLLPRTMMEALKNLRESYQQLKHAHQLAAAACRRKQLNLPG